MTEVVDERVTISRAEHDALFRVVEAARALFTDDVSDQRTLEGDMRAALDGYETLNSAKQK